ncbi:hypothetical protein [Lysobacter gummosus]
MNRCAIAARRCGFCARRASLAGKLRVARLRGNSRIGLAAGLDRWRKFNG